MTEPTTWVGLIWYLLTQEYWQTLLTIIAVILVIKWDDSENR